MRIIGPCILENKINKCIIGGGSAFIDTLNLSLLEKSENICVIGCNHWGLNYKCDIGIVQDAWLFPVTTLRLREKVNILALKDYELHKEIRSKADLLFCGSSKEITKQYNGSLWCGRTGALGALQLALQLGFKDILCVGFDCTKNYSNKWPEGRVNEFKLNEIAVFKERIKELEKFFNVKVHNANPTNHLSMPYKDYYEFIREI